MIILSALGTGAYREATYHFEGQDSTVRTGFFAAALAQWYPEARVVILATQGALKGPNGEHLTRRLPNAEVVSIPNGATEQECWDLFNAVAAAVPEGEEVIFDITHGLRHLPMLGFLVLSYLRVVKRVQIRRVLYGALELTPRNVPAGQEALTQVVDLTPLVTLLDWAQAAKRFEDTGDASMFQPLLAVKQKADYNLVARQLPVFSQAMVMNRGQLIPTEAARLVELLSKAQSGELLPQQKPFALIMAQLEQQVQPLALTSAEPQAVLLSELAVIEWYFARRLHPQAASLGTEWLISLFGWMNTATLPSDLDERQTLAHALTTLHRERLAGTASASPEFMALSATYNEISQIRNDLMHFGFRPNAAPTNRIQQRMTDALMKLRQIAAVLPAHESPAEPLAPGAGS